MIQKIDKTGKTDPLFRIEPDQESGQQSSDANDHAAEDDGRDSAGQLAQDFNNLKKIGGAHHVRHEKLRLKKRTGDTWSLHKLTNDNDPAWLEVGLKTREGEKVHPLYVTKPQAQARSLAQKKLPYSLRWEELTHGHTLSVLAPESTFVSIQKSEGLLHPEDISVTELVTMNAEEESATWIHQKKRYGVFVSFWIPLLVAISVLGLASYLWIVWF